MYNINSMKQVIFENNILCPDQLKSERFCSASECIHVNRDINKVPSETTANRRYERKMYTTVLLISLCIAIPPLVFVAVYMYFSAEEELGVSVSQYEKQRKKKATEVRQASSQK